MIGAVVPAFFDGGFRLAGIGIAAGIVGGLIFYLIFCAVRGASASRAPRGIMLAALLGAVVAHFVEIQVGFATTASRLYLGVFAGLAFAIGVGGRSADTDESEESAGGSVLLHATIAGVVLMLLTYAFSVPSIDPAAPRFVLLWLFLGTSLAGFTLLVADRATSVRRLATAALGYGAISVGVWLVFAVIHLMWINWKPESQAPAAQLALQIGEHIGNTIVLLYAAVLFMLWLPALAESGRYLSTGSRFTRRSPAFAAASVTLVAGAVAVAAVTNLNSARADALSKLASSFERERRWDQARIFHQEALRLQPNEAAYAANLGRALTTQARTVTEATPEQRRALLRQASAIISRVQRENPIDPAYVSDLARVHRLWASYAGDPAEQKRHFTASDVLYREATARSPNNSKLWKEWGTLYLEHEQSAEAVEKLWKALRLNHDPETAKLVEKLARSSNLSDEEIQGD
jgi:Flp pilus assembly protein TadD